MRACCRMKKSLFVGSAAESAVRAVRSAAWYRKPSRLVRPAALPWLFQQVQREFWSRLGQKNSVNL